MADKSTKFGMYLLYVIGNDFGVGAQKIKFIKWVKFKMASKMAAQSLFTHGLPNNTVILSWKISFLWFSWSRNSKMMVSNRYDDYLY